jgi:hypothetical protein
VKEVKGRGGNLVVAKVQLLNYGGDLKELVYWDIDIKGAN